MSKTYTHGGDIYSYYEKYGRYPVDFSSSLNPLNAPLEVTNAYVEAYKYSFAYPPHDYKELRKKISQKETASGHRLHWYRPGNRRLSGSACGTISSKSFFSLLCIRQSLTACPCSESGTDHSQNPQSLRRSFYHCGRRMSWLQRTYRQSL